MRKTLKIAGFLIGVLAALIVVREGFFSNTAYFVIVGGARLYADGKPVSGWLHKGGKGRIFILTRNGIGKRESYWVNMPGERIASILGCGDWTAPKFPLVAIFDVNPPCFSISQADQHNPISKLPERRPDFGIRFLEFTADDGGQIRTSW
jgi:hypothetical protein